MNDSGHLGHVAQLTTDLAAALTRAETAEKKADELHELLATAERARETTWLDCATMLFHAGENLQLIAEQMAPENRSRITKKETPDA